MHMICPSMFISASLEFTEVLYICVAKIIVPLFRHPLSAGARGICFLSHTRRTEAINKTKKLFVSCKFHTFAKKPPVDKFAPTLAHRVVSPTYTIVTIFL